MDKSNFSWGGTPCQSFSVAGLRKGLSDERGNLALEFIKLADRAGPKWIVWENVPGVLSSGRGRDFGSFLGALAEIGYGYAWRVLDAQYFGVAQRRRRVFLVGYFGDWRPAAAVLFERESLRGNPPPSRKAEKAVAALTANGVETCGADDNQGQAGHLIASTGNVAHCLNAGGMGRQDYETETLVAHTLRGEDFDASEDGTGRGTPLVPVGVTIHGTDGTISVASYTEIAGALRARTPGCQENSSTTVVQTFEARTVLQAAAFDWYASQSQSMPVIEQGCPSLKTTMQPAVSVSLRGRDGGATAEIGDEVAGALRASQGGRDKAHVLTSAVRRLTPIECERLQGFPDGFTQIPWRGKDIWECPDGPRYKALGNSMAVPCMTWLGRRIKIIEEFI